MSVYRVSITANGDKTTYTINSCTLAETAKTDAGYTMTTNGKTQAFTTPAEAEAAAKDAVTKILASVGCTPNFINK